MKRTTAYTLLNVGGAVANGISFGFLHNPAVSYALKGVSFLCNMGAAEIQKKEGNLEAAKDSQIFAAFDAGSSFLYATGTPEGSAAPSACSMARQILNVIRYPRSSQKHNQPQL
jgi:hypothetical protein